MAKKLTLENYFGEDYDIDSICQELLDKYTVNTPFGISIEPAIKYIDGIKGINKSSKQELKDHFIGYCLTGCMNGKNY